MKKIIGVALFIAILSAAATLNLKVEISTPNAHAGTCETSDC